MVEETRLNCTQSARDLQSDRDDDARDQQGEQTNLKSVSHGFTRISRRG